MGLVSGTGSSDKQQERSFVSRISSMTKGISTELTGRARSLPVTPVAERATSSSDEHVIDILKVERKEQRCIRRSYSEPINFSSSLEGVDSLGLDQMILTSSLPCSANDFTMNSATQTNNASEAEGTENVEEKAVCRICLVELEECGDTFKMECSCKGELALAHQECAVQWFSIKGNLICDVCKQDVQNLSATLLKKRVRSDTSQQGEDARYRVWWDVPVLVLVSMLAYFCFMEQLLVAEMGTHAFALSLPFSCVLGLLSSMIASIAVSRSHIWAYASIQFLIVIVFAHIMSNMMGVTPVLAVLLSSFIAFGVTMSVNSLVMEYLTSVARHLLQSAQQQVVRG